jgi:choloylglycine hydrolase
MKRDIIILMLAFTFMVSVSNAHPFTSLSFDNNGQIVIAVNYDWSIGEGLIIVNKRGVKKIAEQHRNLKSDKPARWTSKFGSGTFNQIGR